MTTESWHIKKGRDAMSNGRLLARDIDLRSSAGRRFKFLTASYADEFGGLDQLSAVDRELVRQAATLSLTSERLASDVAKGAAIDGDMLVRISSELRRVIGMLRAAAARNEPPPPSPITWWAQRQASAAIDAENKDVTEEQDESDG
jgi:hypothetical protein